MLIPYDTNGNIPPGIHYYTYEMFRKQFVDDIQDSMTRIEIHHLSFLWLAELERIITPIEIWFSGEYVTSERNPNEIEICVFLLHTSFNKDVAELCLALMKKSQDQSRFHVYFGFIYEDGKMGPLGPYYWTEQLGFDPVNTPKGIIVLPWEEVSSALK